MLISCADASAQETESQAEAAAAMSVAAEAAAAMSVAAETTAAAGCLLSHHVWTYHIQYLFYFPSPTPPASSLVIDKSKTTTVLLL